MTAVRQAGFVLYRVVVDYDPPSDYEAGGCMAIKRGDMLEVKSPVQLEEGTEQQPKGEFF